MPLGKSFKKNEYVPEEKKAKNHQNLSFFQKNDLNFAISKFLNSFKIPFSIGLKRSKRLVLEKILKNNENIEKEIKPKNRSKLPTFKR